MRIFNLKPDIEYIAGRDNLAVTIFVPYDCPNHCPFCTSKDEYKDTSKFDLPNILNSINEVGQFNDVTEFVITGGEPFADLDKLQDILDNCSIWKKPIFINTTLPVKDAQEALTIFNFILENKDIISGINVSRHMMVKTNLELDSLIEAIHNATTISLRINSVLIDVKAEKTRVKDFIDKYAYFVNSINFRGDYTKIKNQDDLRGLDHPLLNVLFDLPNLEYLGSGGCLVCNDNTFYTKAGHQLTYISLHRGYEHSCVKKGRYYIINDIIIKQDGRILCDWDGEELDLEELKRQWR